MVRQARAERLDLRGVRGVDRFGLRRQFKGAELARQ